MVFRLDVDYKALFMFRWMTFYRSVLRRVLLWACVNFYLISSCHNTYCIHDMKHGRGYQQVHLQDTQIFFILKNSFLPGIIINLTVNITFSACKLDFVCNGWKRFQLRGLHRRANRNTKRCQISRCSKFSVRGKSPMLCTLKPHERFFYLIRV